MSLNNGGPEFAIARFFWESCVAEAHRKYSRAVASDDALFKSGIDNQRLFHKGVAADEALNSPHSRFTIVPQAQTRAIEGISHVIVRLPLWPAAMMPDKHVGELLERGALVTAEDDDLPTNDVFFEAIKTTGESQRFLLTENGVLAYYDSSDINITVDQTANELVRFYDVVPSIDTVVEQQRADREWPDVETFYKIFHQYDVFPQETTGPTSSIAS